MMCNSNSILILVSSIAIGVSSAAPSQQLENSPSLEVHIHHDFVQRKLGDILPKRRLKKEDDDIHISFAREEDIFGDEDDREYVLEDYLLPSEEERCPGSPFLWKIIDDSDGTHVGK